MNDEERIDRGLEGLLNAEEWERLQADVIADPELRATYSEWAWLHGQLRAEKQSLPHLIEAEADVVSVNFWWPAVWASAAAIVTAFLMLSFRPGTEVAAVATLIEAEDCRWAGSELPTAQGSRLGVGTLVLVEGMATLEFESGARVTLEAPSTLEVLSEMHCRLIEGSVVADVPEPAHGFTIDAPEVKVVDLGTRFGVTASRFGNSQVIVFDGEVEVERGGEEPRLLTTGNSMHIGHQAPAENHEISRTPVAANLRDGWRSVTTADGRGKDAYVRRGGAHGPTGGHPLIMVKHTDLAAGNERRAFLTFDLAGIGEQGIEDVELVLDVEASGLGFSALVPDSRFEVYGLSDGAADLWSEGELKWNAAPASTDAGLIPDHTAWLGEFRIRRGHVPANVSVSSPTLRDFVRTDANRLVTLAIVRVTGENDKQGLVHAFASKEHPTAQPPTLHLKLSKK
jgi:hypothetical protein